MKTHNTGYVVDYEQLPKPDRAKGVVELGYKKLLYTDYFFQWNSENSQFFPTLNNLAHAWGLKSDTIKKVYEKRGIELHFAKEPLYKDRDWCIEQFIKKHKTVREVAKETGYKLRVLQKWAQEIHKLNIQAEHKNLRLTERQFSLIYGGILGDGCISEEGQYYVGHCESQKEYLEWQREELVDLCTGAYGIGHRIKAKKRIILNKLCSTQNFYQFSTRKLNELKQIRLFGRQIDIAIEHLDPLALSIYFLDDGSCDKMGYWSLCCGVLSYEQCVSFMEKSMELIQVRGKLNFRQNGRGYYVLWYNREESERISSMIKEHVPNDLDVVRKKMRYYNSLQEA